MGKAIKQLEKINSFLSTIKFLYLLTGIFAFLSCFPNLEELTFWGKVVVGILSVFLWLPLLIVAIIEKFI